MATRRRYTKAEKLAAIVKAEASSIKRAAEEQGIPERTLGYWMDRPEFAVLRAKTRADLARGMELLAHRAQEVLLSRVPDMEPRDLTILLGVATDKAQLLSGAATSRTETKALTEGLDDHERAALRDIIDGAVAEAAPSGARGDQDGAGAEVRE